MVDWSKILVEAQTSILDTMRIIDAGAMQIALVVDGDRRLLGTVTDGDVRRGLLGGLSLDSPVLAVMNANATVAPAYESPTRIKSLMHEKQLRQIPIVDSDGFLIGLEHIDELSYSAQYDNWVVLMVGGRGARLRPLTDDCPKPLLKVGGRPVLETIVAQLLDQGFSKFYMAVNYKADMVRAHFGNGSKFGAEIRYLEEDIRLGTAGALTLLPQKMSSPVIVMNGDLITKLDFRNLMKFHTEEKAYATVCIRTYDFQVPYGVVQLNGSRLLAIEEKPTQQFYVNAGIYVLSPNVIESIPENQYVDMPTIISNAANEENPVCAFPITEYWIDIGKADDLNRAEIDAAISVNTNVVSSHHR